jgi:hypothetical protein
VWLYPALEIVHIVGIVLLVGPAFMFDLRLLGLAKKIPVAALADYLLPWSRRALILVIPSGLFLFATNAATLAYDAVFWLKMILLIAAGFNALVFHRLTFPVGPAPGENMQLPTAARAAAIASILLWLSIITCGRLLAY